MWIEIASRVEKVSRKQVLVRSQYFIRVLQLYGVVVAIAMFASRNYTLGQGLLIPLCLFGIVLYPVGKHSTSVPSTLVLLSFLYRTI